MVDTEFFSAGAASSVWLLAMLAIYWFDFFGISATLS